MGKKRIMIKLSGEALAGKNGIGIDPQTVRKIAREIKSASDLGLCEISLVVGGGNIFRGKLGDEMGIERASADYMGMIGTIINALALQNSLEALGVETRVLSSLNIPEVCEPYIRRKAISHLEKGRLVIFGGGTGNPFFTTDTTSALRAAEMDASIIYMAKNGIDGETGESTTSSYHSASRAKSNRTSMC